MEERKGEGKSMEYVAISNIVDVDEKEFAEYSDSETLLFFANERLLGYDNGMLRFKGGPDSNAPDTWIIVPEDMQTTAWLATVYHFNGVVELETKEANDPWAESFKLEGMVTAMGLGEASVAFRLGPR